MKKLIKFSCFILFLFLFVNLTLAQEWDVTYIATEVFWIPEEWLATPANIIYNLIIPFLAIFAVCLGFLRQLRIFSRAPNIEIVLAFAIAFSTLPTHAFIWLVSGSLAFAGYWAYAAFFILFLVGIVFYGLALGTSWSGAVDVAKTRKTAIGSIQQQITDIKEKKGIVHQDMANNEVGLASGTLSKDKYESMMNNLRQNLAQLDVEERNLHERLNTLEKETS